MAVFETTLFSNSLKRITHLTAILPVEMPIFPGFEPPKENKPFRSIYLLHGYSGSNVDWIRGTRIEQLAQMHRIAVFCPSGDNSFYIDDKLRDALYEQYICKELVEFTRRVFPLSHEKKDTSIGGLSMGGYGAIRNGLKHPEVFGNIAAFSSALITDGLDTGLPQPGGQAGPNPFQSLFGEPGTLKGSDVDPKALAKKLMDGGAERPNLYMACGSEDFLIEPNRDLHKCLTEIGYDHIYMESPGTHSWAFWDDYIEKALIWLDGLEKK